MKEYLTKFKLSAQVFCTKRMVILSICLFLVVFGAFTGALLTKIMSEPSTDAGNIGELCVLPDTLVRVVKNYSCGHTRIYETKEYTGYTKSMLLSIENCKVDTMTGEYVCLVIDTEEYCNDHYLLMLVEKDVLCVFSTNTDKDGREQIMEIMIDTESITQTEYNDLKKGIVFDSLEEINAYIENIET